MLSVSGGLEPLFATEFYRTTKSLHGEDVKYKVFADIVDESRKAQEWQELPDFIVTSHNLNSMQRIQMQATWQKYIDAAISSTINLPKETTKQEVFDIYVEAWKNKLKGCTIYRAGGEREGILIVDGNDELPDIKKQSLEEVDNKEWTEEDYLDHHLCPECHEELSASEGCFVCANCGWGKCSL
jgi:ribonucleoside-diphosphate reductase alpha chain